MSGGQNEKFLERKADYLNTHFIVWRESQVLTGSGIYDFDLKKDNNLRITGANGGRLSAVILQPVASRGKATGRFTHAIRAYYLQYQPNRSFHATLGDDVDFCFTPTLNGCSFVVGPGPNPTISHYNFVDNPNAQNPTVDQAKIDRHIARRYAGGGETVLRRGDYKVGPAIDYKVTIVGIREGNGWHFYYQRRAEDLAFVPGQGSQLVTIAVNQRVQLT